MTVATSCTCVTCPTAPRRCSRTSWTPHTCLVGPGLRTWQIYVHLFLCLCVSPLSVTHHNSITLQGTKVSRESAGPLDMALTSNVSMTDGFVSAVLGGWSRALDSYTVTFRPPCRLEYRTQKGQRTNYMICYCVPQGPGQCGDRGMHTQMGCMCVRVCVCVCVCRSVCVGVQVVPVCL